MEATKYDPIDAPEPERKPEPEPLPPPTTREIVGLVLVTPPVLACLGFCGYVMVQLPWQVDVGLGLLVSAIVGCLLLRGT